MSQTNRVTCDLYVEGIVQNDMMSISCACVCTHDVASPKIKGTP